ncbi:MAG: GIY-YIG nuclease family protein [Bacilli bacterium]|nr:GIY-YIG nuclease family protein [Bacilli bacterium]
MNKVGVIYILYNPDFKFVKIGYTGKTVQERLRDLNEKTAVPHAYREYGHLDVDKKDADKELHDFIDLVDPKLRVVDIDPVTNKKRKREFYDISKEKAEEILNQYAKIKGYENRFIKLPPTREEIIFDEETEIKKETKNISVEKFLENKDLSEVNLFYSILEAIKNSIPNYTLYCTNAYVGLKNNIGRVVSEFHFKKKGLQILTKEPISKNLIAGERVPDSFEWTLNYRFFVDEKDIKNIAKILTESNEQIIEKKPRKEAFSFDKANIPVGSKIIFERDESIAPTVIDSKHVEWKGKKYSVSALAIELLGYTCAGTLYFTYNGKLLSDYID